MEDFLTPLEYDESNDDFELDEDEDFDIDENSAFVIEDVEPLDDLAIDADLFGIDEI